MAEISVMMAAYNAESYIRRALDSILASTFQDFDIIVVDDGSTDQTGAIAEEYARLDSRIHVLHQENQGPCITKNRCLDWTYGCSDSQWIIFIDSDDWIHPEMLERMLNSAKNHHVRICACGFAETTGADPQVEPAELEPVLWDPMEFYKTHFINACMACCKLYHKDCYRDVRHPNARYFDDEYVTYRLLYPEQTIAVIPAPLYAYFINPNGLTKSTWRPHMLDAWEAYEEQIAFFKEKGREDLVNFRYRGYLDNALVNERSAQEAGDGPEMVEARKRIHRKIKELLCRMWRQGCIQFWIDYDLLYRFYPIRTRAYRLWITKLGGKLK